MPWQSWHKRLEWPDKETDTEQGEKHGEEENCELAKGNCKNKEDGLWGTRWLLTLRINIIKRSKNTGNSEKEHKE